MSLISLALRQNLKQLSHVIVKCDLEFADSPLIILLSQSLAHAFRLLLDALLPALEVRHVIVLFELLFVVHPLATAVVVVFCGGFIKGVVCLDVLERAEDNPAEEVRGLVDLSEDAEEVLVCDEAFFQAFVQEVIVRYQDFIYSLGFHQAVFELVEVRLQDLHYHVVDVVLAELRHPIPEKEGFLQHAIH